MARVQTLVQLSDHLLALLDEKAAATGSSRSALIRRAVEEFVHDEQETAIDQAIAEGYRRHPAPEPDEATFAQAIASIEEEPW